MNQSGMAATEPFGGFLDPHLEAIAEKMERGARLTDEDGLILQASRDLLAVGWLANRVRERLHGNKTFYNINRHLNYSNICVNRCRFCAFSRTKGEAGAWQYSLEEIFAKADADLPPGATELHIVGGLHPDLPLEYYLEMLRGLRERHPAVHLKAFTAAEIAHLARLGGLTVRTVLERLIDAGLGSLPGGGAEVFAPRTRRLTCAEKISPEEWLDVHRTAHRLGLRSNCTMLYGHLETAEERIEHLLRLRALQDETGGFQAFIPLAFHPRGSRLEDLPGPSGADDLRLVATARLMLDNIPHIKAYWIMLGVKTAQVALAFGADDLDGTVGEETISHMAGAESPQRLTIGELRKLIAEAGRTPVERDTLYRER